MNNQVERPVVDINIAVYNQALYLRETLNSALAQETSFKFRLLIGDDFSTDGSREILQEYEAKYADQIKVIYQDRNLGFKSADTNGLRILKYSTAKYVAFLDGDDYWVDTLKLQKQVDFLENNKEYVACCSNVFERTGDELKPVFGKLDKITFGDLVLGNSIHTCSVVFKNIVEIPEWYTQCKMGEWVIWLLLAKHGSIFLGMFWLFTESIIMEFGLVRAKK
jgi:glycosyltransferase involved in cell wall biosynthesis